MWLPDLADPEWITEVVRRHAGQLGIESPVLAVETVDVRLSHPHRPGWARGGGWATYLVHLPGADPHRLYVRGFPDGLSLPALRRLDDDPSGSRPRHLPDVDLLVWRFPDDPGLPALAGLIDPGRVRGLLPPVVVDTLCLGPESELRVELVRHQPATSATVRIETDEVSVFAKHLAAGDLAALAANHESLWCLGGRCPALRLAQPLALDALRRVLWTRGVPGEPLSGAVPSALLPAATARTGPVLAALHGAPVSVGHHLDVSGLLGEARKKAAKLAVVHPPVASLVAEIVAGATGWSSVPGQERIRVLHGDFHIDQLIWSQGEPVLVDLDTLTHGHPEADLAEFAVDLAQREVSPDIARATVASLLTSYADSAGLELDHDLLAVLVDAEFLNRCYRHVRRQAPRWRDSLEAGLARHAEVRSLVAA